MLWTVVAPIPITSIDLRKACGCGLSRPFSNDPFALDLQTSSPWDAFRLPSPDSCSGAVPKCSLFPPKVVGFPAIAVRSSRVQYEGRKRRSCSPVYS